MSRSKLEISRAMGRSLNSFPPAIPDVSRKSQMIPIYAADGTSLGFRTREAAERLVAGDHVKPAYGRKGHLKAIFLQREDGGNPVEVRPRRGTRYSFLQNLDGGRCWSLRQLDARYDDGKVLSTRGAFLQVLADCLTP
jgi:hypothetical protein